MLALGATGVAEAKEAMLVVTAFGAGKLKVEGRSRPEWEKAIDTRDGDREPVGFRD